MSDPLPRAGAEAALNAAIIQHVQMGWRVEARYGNQAVLARGGNVAHVLHGLLTCFTCGLWAPVWILLVLVDNPQRITLTVDDQGRVVAGGLPFAGPPLAPPSRFQGNQHAIALANMRRELRRQARMHAQDIVMARELRIGRPDLPRHYDDGGLIDFNHAPAEVLMSVTGITREMAEHIITVRETVIGFSSAEELSAVAQLPPHLTPEINEYGIFLP